MTEFELIVRAQAGDPGAFGPVAEMYQTAIYHLCCRMLGNASEAEDATQEAFLRAYSQLHRYDPGRPFKAWLFAVASHHCIDRLRQRRWRWLSLDEELLPTVSALPAAAPGPEDLALRRELCDEIAALLRGLAPQDRCAVVLHYWCGLSYAEIAEVLGSTVSAVKSRLHRARQTLGRRMAAEAGQRAPRPQASKQLLSVSATKKGSEPITLAA